MKSQTLQCIFNATSTNLYLHKYYYLTYANAGSNVSVIEKESKFS